MGNAWWGVVMGKSLIFFPSSPPRNLGIFGDFTPKKYQNLSFSCLQNAVPIPKNQAQCARKRYDPQYF